MTRVDLSAMTEPSSPSDVLDELTKLEYVADAGLATVVYLALSLKRPLFLEGEAGVGKTELAKKLSEMSGGELIRLQCHEGIDAAQALYEWDYSRQLLHLRTAEVARVDLDADGLESELYDERFLVRRPVLRAISSTAGPPPILLIDEIDRADDEFEAFLLEVLSDYSVTIPEIGTYRAETPPVVVITSNRTRDVHDALKRRCLYHWVEHPEFEQEVQIIGLKAPEATAALSRQVAAATASMRKLGLYKPPGVAESIDWAHSLAQLGATRLDEAMLRVTLGAVLKYREDQQRVLNAGLADLLEAVGKV
jgi:MoxR-like ATPase